MANIDTSKIENYQNMTAEEKVAALEAYTFDAPAPEADPNVENLKRQISRANGEAASWKQKFHERLSEQEKAEATRNEELENLKAELNLFKTNDRINSYKAKLLEIGYDAESANSLAKSLPEGVEDSFWEVQKAFLANNAQKIKTDLLSKQSSLSAGQAPKPEDPESKQIAAFRQAMGLK